MNGRPLSCICLAGLWLSACVDDSPVDDGDPGSGGSGVAGSGSESCGAITENPFDCDFAWGAPAEPANWNTLDFVSTWIGDEPNGGLDTWSATGINESCGDCDLVQTVGASSATVVFYTYFIGFQARSQGGFGDCNVDDGRDPGDAAYDGRNLCTDGAQWIRDNRAEVVHAYGEYARVVHEHSPGRPTIWWLEGDFIQYSYQDQSSPLSYAELGALSRDITCAIKSNAPNAVVAMNHSPWVLDTLATGFWAAQPLDDLDLVWVQGPGDADAFVNAGEYNAETANYAWLHGFTGKPIMAETSYAWSGADDRWTSATVDQINARIENGVIGVLVNSPPDDYQAALTALDPALGSTCD